MLVQFSAYEGQTCLLVSHTLSYCNRGKSCCFCFVTVPSGMRADVAQRFSECIRIKARRKCITVFQKLARVASGMYINCHDRTTVSCMTPYISKASLTDSATVKMIYRPCGDNSPLLIKHLKNLVFTFLKIAHDNYLLELPFIAQFSVLTINKITRAEK